MEMKDQLVEAARRARGYRFADGLLEIGGGILFMVLSIPYLLWSLAPQGSRLARLASNGRNAVLILGVALVCSVIWAVKERWTYPRSGYVEERRPERGRVLRALAILGGALVLIGLVVAGFLFIPAFRTGLLYVMAYAASFLGLCLALGWLVMGFRCGIRRFHLLAGIAALTSLGLAVASRLYLVAHPFDWAAISTAPEDPMPAGSGAMLLGLAHNAYTGVAIFLAVLGLAMLVSGLFVRAQFLRSNPIAQAETK
jgi:hypothetical protein